MAVCDPQTLKTQAQCIVPCVTIHELLASIACSLATLNGMSCSPAALKSQAACIWPCMSEIELLASIACSLATGGTGGKPQVFQGSGPPAGLQVGQDGTIGNLYYDTDVGGLDYFWSVAGQTWY